MALPVQVTRCKILKEFSPEQRRQFFGFFVNKALHHIDTLYYCVYLNEPEDIVKLQRDDDLPEYLVLFLDFLRSNKDVMRDYTGSAPQFGELEMTLKSFAGYEYCVSLPECFDIFICRILPNADTPRIVVQLRSRYLVLEGVKAAVEKSFSYLREFLGPFGMCPVRVPILTVSGRKSFVSPYIDHLRKFVFKCERKRSVSKYFSGFWIRLV